MKKLTYLTLLISLLTLSLPCFAEILFSDSFEDSNLSTAPTYANNQINFRWDGTNYTALVSMNPGPVKVYGMSGEMFAPEADQTKDWSAFDGSVSLRFNYNAGMNQSEQRFYLDPQQDLWIRYWIRVPHNFYHGGMNNKFFSIFGSTYDGPGTTTFETRPSSAGSSYIYLKDGGAVGIDEQPTPFINASTDRGKWMQIVIHVKNETADNANDGVIQLFRRWEGEDRFTTLLDKQNSQRQWEAGTLGYRQGYFMGWANGPYSEQTEWLIDQVEFSNTALLEATLNNSGGKAPSNFSGSVIKPTAQ